MRINLIADFNYLCGSRTFFEMLVKALQRRNVDVRAFVALPPDDARFDAFASEHKLLWESIPERKGLFRKALFSPIWELVQLGSLIRRHRPDMIIVSTRIPGDWLTPFLLPLPAIQILHSIVEKAEGRKKFLFRTILQHCSAKQRLITVSDFAAQQIALHWDYKATYIHNPTTFPDVVDMPKKRTEKRIITVGGVFEYKNPYVWFNAAVRVLQRHPDASFAWYGEGPMLEKMRRYAKGYPQIMFLGASTEIRNAYTDAALYFHPSALENHSIALLEAMSYGLPSVVSDRGGLPETAVNAETGYVVHVDDPQTFAEKICFLLEHPEIAHQFGHNAQKRIKDYFMPEQWEAKFFSLVKNCLPSNDE